MNVFIAVLVLGLLALGAVACGSSESDDDQGPTPRAFDVPPSSSPAADAGISDNDEVSSGFQRGSPFVPLDAPEFITPAEATFLEADDLVLGVTIDGDSRAYPLRMMTFHHIVNDSFDGRPILVTF
ncbi:MAG: DUF3179 domain-containing protein [Chloroflexi bacterium]|nr:DUF3179 domain-containing protein [Chloroflexota bacterium]